MKDNVDLIDKTIWLNNDIIINENEDDNINLIGKVTEYNNISCLFNIDVIYPNKEEKKVLSKVELPKQLSLINEFNEEEMNKILEIDDFNYLEYNMFNEKLTYYIIERLKKGNYFTKINNNILLSYLNKNNFKIEESKIFNNFYQNFFKNTNKDLILFGEQLSGKSTFLNYVLNYFISKFPNSEQNLINGFKKGYELYKLFSETYDNHSRCNLLIQFMVKDNKIHSIKIIPNSLMPFSYNNFYKIFHICLNHIKKDNVLNQTVSQILKSENLLDIEELYSYLSLLKIPDNECTFFKNSLLAITHLINEDYKNFFTLLSIKDYDNNIKRYRNILIRYLHFKLFEWLIKKINIFLNNNSNQIKNTNEEYKCFSFYDSMSYSKNICCNLYDMIENYTYEKLISLFYKFGIGNILEEYKRESLNIKYHFIDNKEVIELFENEGIFDIINSNKDKEKTDKSIHLNIYEKLSQNISLGNKEENFISINHSFGDICYKYDGLLKDNILLTKEIIILLSKSQNTIVNKFNNNQSEETMINYYLKQIKEFYSVFLYSNCYFIQFLHFPENNIEKEIFHQIYSYSLPEIINFNNKKLDIKFTNKEFISIVKYYSSNINHLIEEKKEFINSNNIIKIKNLVIEIFTTYLVENMDLNKLLNNDEIQIGLSSIYFTKKGYEWMKKFLIYTKKIKIIQKNYRTYISNKKNKIEEIKEEIKEKKKEEIKEEKKEERKEERKLQNENSLSSKIKNQNNENKIENNKINEKNDSLKKPKKKSVLDILTKPSNDLKKEDKEKKTINNLKDEVINLKNVQDHNNQLQKENEKLKQINKELNDKIKKKEEEEKNYKNLIEELKNKIILLNIEIEEQGKIIDTQKKEIEKLTEDNHKIIDENEKLKKEINDLKNKNLEYEKNNNELNNKIKEDNLSNSQQRNSVSSNNPKMISHLKLELNRQKNLNIKLTSNYNEEHEKYIKIKEELEEKIKLLDVLELQLSNEKGNYNILNKNNLLNRNKLIQGKRINKNNENKISNLEDDIYNITGNIGLFKKALSNKNTLIKNKNKIIELLYSNIKNKNLEIQCYKIYKFINEGSMQNLKERILKIKAKENNIIKDINNLINEEKNLNNDIINFNDNEFEKNIDGNLLNFDEIDKKNDNLKNIEKEFVFDDE